MLGDEILLGNRILNVDSKQRIIIPVETKREEGESLVIIQDNDLDVLRVYNQERYMEKIEILEEMISKSTNEKEIKYYRKEIYNILRNILRVEKVKSQGRIIIGNELEKVKKIRMIGAKDHLIIVKEEAIKWAFFF